MLSNYAPGNYPNIDSPSALGKFTSGELDKISTAISLANQQIESNGVNIAAMGAVWTPWTPVATAAAGSLTSYTVTSATYLQTGKMVSFHFHIVITNAGTGTNQLLVTLPVAAVAKKQSASGLEVAVSGKFCPGFIGRLGDFTRVSLFFYDATSPIVTNNELVCSGTYEAA